MAKISETELQRRLKYLERNSGSASENNFVSNEDPTAGSYSENDTHFNAATNNLWLFKNGVWELDTTILHIRYADSVSPNPPVVQADIVGFSEDPLSVDGSIKNWRGLWWGDLTASTNPLAYEWIDSSTNPPELERYRTDKHGLRSDVGTPDSPTLGSIWTLGGPLADTMWLADRFTIDGQKGPWEVYPVQAADTGFPLIRYEKTGYNQPTLGDSVWIQDVVLAAVAFTGRPFTNQKELGYGAIVVIKYDDGTLVGKYIRASGSDSWVSMDNLIEGDLVVDGTLVGDKLKANTIDATKIVLSGVGAIGAATIGADPAGSADAIADNIYTSNTTTIEGGNITTGTIQSDKITMDGPIEFSAQASGLKWNKNAYGDGSYGGFIGRHVTSGGNDAIGLDFTSAQSSIRMSSGGRLITQGILLETGVPGASVEYDTVGTHNFPITTGAGSLLSIVLTGSGSGGCNNWVASFHPNDNRGYVGVASTMQFYNGSTPIGSVITAAGGPRPALGSQTNASATAGTPGQASIHAAGGLGGAANAGGTGGNGSRGSGGGSAGSSGSQTNAASPYAGIAGTTLADVLTVPSGATHLRITIAAGGSGGTLLWPYRNTPREYPDAAGGNGGAGYASVTPPSSGSQLFDFDDLATNSVPWPTLGEMTTTSLGSLTNLGSGGAGWYYVAVINGNNGNGSAANFVGMPHYYGGTPTAGGTSAIWYKMK